MGVKSFFKSLACRCAESAVIVGVIIFLPMWPPEANFTDSTILPPIKPLTGKLAINEKLNNVELWHKGELEGPECIVDYDGDLYTGLIGGDVVKLVGKDHIVPIVKFGKACNMYHEERLCGRPLGMRFDNNGNLIVADSYYGIWKVDVKTGHKQLIVSPEEEIDGVVPKIFNSVAIASNGDIYFTSSSSDFDLQDGVYTMFADPSGRLIRYDAKTKTKTVLIDKIHFANGVHLSDDEEFVIVAETLRSRILRYYLKGPKKGTKDIFIDAIPGVPDNLSSDGKGGFLVPFPLTGDADHPLINQQLSPYPLARKLIARFMGILDGTFQTIDRLYPNDFSKRAAYIIGHFGYLPKVFKPERVTVLRLSKEGEIIDSLHATNGKMSDIAEAHIYKDTLYLGSYSNDYIAKISLSKIGWDDLITDGRTKREAKPQQTTETARSVPKKDAPKQTTTSAPSTTTTPAPTTPPPSKQSPPPKMEAATPKPSQQAAQQPKQKVDQTGKTQPPTPTKSQTTAAKQEQVAAPSQQATTTAQPQKQAAPQQQKEPTKSAKTQASSQKVQTTSEKVQTRPQKAQATPEKVQATPEKTQVKPEKIQSTRQKEKATPEKIEVTPDKVKTTPQKAQTIPQKDPATPKKAQAKPTQAQVTPEKATPQKPQTQTSKPSPPKQAPPAA